MGVHGSFCPGIPYESTRNVPIIPDILVDHLFLDVSQFGKERVWYFYSAALEGCPMCCSAYTDVTSPKHTDADSFQGGASIDFPQNPYAARKACIQHDG